ncbi:hypothetical protein HY468_05215 [Candidatus Roizmanbacteria bacterium]|nr:hypothetical protein [Candidatus Roizmanbacteria bacterium]
MSFNVLTTDISGNKYFRIFLIVVIGIWLIAYLMQYNSIESKCERRIDKTSAYFSPINKLHEEALRVAKRQLVEKCIEESKQ